MRLLDRRETKQIIRAYLASRERWTLLDLQGGGLLEAVERTYYAPGAGNEDFHVVMLTLPGTRRLLRTASARNSRMDPAQAAEMLQRHGVQTAVEELERHAVLLVHRDAPSGVRHCDFPGLAGRRGRLNGRREEGQFC